ncbi:hypothetical protein BH23CHL1_BH23CHL1_23270 [soil metagenome]
MPALPREFADRYQVRSPIGEGAFSVTYRAVDSALQRDVAVKVLREQYAAHEGFDSRFEREARAAARISHPNVISVYDYGRQGTLPYIVMQFVDGPNLKEYVREEGPLTTEEAINFARQILDGLAAIHDEDIIHRDVKPQNVLIDEGMQAKITDFGVAFVTLDPGLTETGMAVGTAAYMAPEQASGDAVGPPADLYAVGVILYELLTGLLPFSGENPVQVMYRHVNEMPKPPRSLNRGVPLSVEAVVLRALAKDPGDRYPDARTMRNALMSPDSAAADTAMAQAVPPAAITDTDQQRYVSPAPQPRVAQPRRRRAAPSPPPSRWPVVLLVLIIGGLIAILWLLVQSQGFAGVSGNADPTPTEQSAVMGGTDFTPAVAVGPTEETRTDPTATTAPEPAVVDPTATFLPEPEATATLEPEPEPTTTPAEELLAPTATPEEPAPPTETAPPSGQFDTPFSAESLPVQWLNGSNVSLVAEQFIAGGAVEPSEDIGFPGAEVWDQVDVEFNALDDPSAYIGVVIAAMNTPQEGQVPMRLFLNGNQIWEGPSPFPQGEWAEIAWSVGNLGWLSEGTNVLTIHLLGSTGTVLVSNATVFYG